MQHNHQSYQSYHHSPTYAQPPATHYGPVTGVYPYGASYVDPSGYGGAAYLPNLSISNQPGSQPLVMPPGKPLFSSYPQRASPLPPPAPPSQAVEYSQPSGPLETMYVHSSWTDVIPPNGIPGHPSLLMEGVAPARARVTTITIRKPGERETIPTLIQKAGRNARSSKGMSGDFKASLQPSGLSKFAIVYEPLWIRDLRPATHIKRLAPAAPHVPAGYQMAFLPGPLAMSSRFLHHWDSPSILRSPPPLLQTEKRSPVVPEDPELYLKHFTELLALELASLQQKALSYKLNSAQLALERPRTTVVGQFTTSTLGVWTLQVPGIREDAPRIFLGDVVLLRRIHLEQQIAEDFVFEARVIGSLKREGKVYVDSDVLWASDVHSVAGTYQIEFKASSQQVCLMQNAVKMLSGLIHERQKLWFDDLLPSPPIPGKSTALAYLFPTQNCLRHAGGVIPTNGTVKKHIDWVDPDLNKEQKKAIQDIVNGKHDVPYLLFGPAGTGKTKTLVETVLQVVRTHSHASLLVCAPSNSAADTIALRLAKTLDGRLMLRLQNPTRTVAEVPDVLRDSYCNLQNNQFVLPEWQAMMKYRVVVTTCTDAGLLADARLTNADLLCVQSELGQMNPGSIPRLIPHWTHLIIDEAGQAMEPETLIPLSVVTTGEEEIALVDSARPVVVLCGDIKQLPAIVSCDQAREGGLDVSLLERLMERPLYQETEDYITCLAINYRSHSGILWLPNTLFYNDRLQPCDNVPLSKWPGLPNPKLPILVKNVDGEDDWVEEGASWFNPVEVKECRDIVLSLLAGPDKFKQSEIGVVTPWREQVLNLRKEFRDSGLWDVNIGNVEAYQGAEYRCVIISCVRSRSQFVPSDQKKGMGFIHEPKRFNVAITRAKELLVVVGNCKVHSEDPSFRELLRLALRNNFYVGPNDLELSTEDGTMSRLEINSFAESSTRDVSLAENLKKHGMFVTNGMVRSLFE